MDDLTQIHKLSDRQLLEEQVRALHRLHGAILNTISTVVAMGILGLLGMALIALFVYSLTWRLDANTRYTEAHWKSFIDRFPKQERSIFDSSDRPRPAFEPTSSVRR